MNHENCCQIVATVGNRIRKTQLLRRFRRAILIPTRQSESFSKHICLENQWISTDFVENRLVYPENEIVLVAEK